MRRYKITAFLIIFTVLMAFGVTAASAKATFEIKLPEDLPKAGDSFEVSVDISNNPDFCGVEFTLTYDKRILTCDDAYLDGVLERAVGAINTKADDGAKIGAVSLKTISGDGVLAVFEFTAKEDITEFDFELEKVSLIDEDGDDIAFKISGGKTIGNITDDKDSEITDEDTNDDLAKDEDSKEPESPDNKEEEDKPSDDDPEEELKKEPSKDDTDDKEPSDTSGEDEDDDKESSDTSKDDKEDTKTESSESTPPTEEKEEPVKEYNFPDVVGHWSEKYVIKSANLGLFVGDTDGNFRPDDNVTRAQFITVLWRMAGRETVNVTTPFTDIENQLPEFKDAIAWGYAKGYINGISETEFDPASPITREAGMKILHYYSGGKVGMEIQLYPIYNGIFKDSSEISSWAQASLYWGIYNKMISGMSDEILAPKGYATRAQLAKILVNYLDIN